MNGIKPLQPLSNRLSGLSAWQQVVGGLLLFTIILVALTAAVHSLLEGINFGMDYFVFWNAGRSAVVEQINPYSDEVTLANQIGIYGHPAEPGRDRMPFANPPYALIPMLPAVWMPFTWAQPYWLVLNILLLLTVALVAFPAHPWRAIVTMLCFYPFAFGLILGNYAVLIAASVMLYYGALVSKERSSRLLQAVAGVFLAWATCKPQFSALYIVVTLLFALRKRQFTFLVSFFTGLLAFLLLSFWIVPGWPLKWFSYLSYYSDNNQTFPFAQRLLGLVFSPQAAAQFQIVLLGLVGLLLAGLVWLWWRHRINELQLLAAVGLATYLIHPQNVIAYEQLILLVPFFLWTLDYTTARRPAVRFIWLTALVASWLPFALRFVWPIDENIIFGLILGWAIWLLLNKSKPSLTPQPAG